MPVYPRGPDLGKSPLRGRSFRTFSTFSNDSPSPTARALGERSCGRLTGLRQYLDLNLRGGGVASHIQLVTLLQAEP